MTRKLWWLVGFAVVGLLLFLFWRRPSEPAIPPKVQQEIDSLRIAKRTTDSILAVHRVRDQELAEAAARATVQAQAHQSTADKERDTATHFDSSGAYRDAYDARTREALALRQVIADKDVIIDTMAVRIRLLQSTVTIDSTRIVALEKLNGELVDAATHASECKIAGVIRCPSRTKLVVATVVVVKGFELLHDRLR